MRQIMLEDTTVERLPEVLSSLRMDLAQREEEAKVISEKLKVNERSCKLEDCTSWSTTSSSYKQENVEMPNWCFDLINQISRNTANIGRNLMKKKNQNGQQRNKISIIILKLNTPGAIKSVLFKGSFLMLRYNRINDF